MDLQVVSLEGEPKKPSHWSGNKEGKIAKKEWVNWQLTAWTVCILLKHNLEWSHGEERKVEHLSITLMPSLVDSHTWEPLTLLRVQLLPGCLSTEGVLELGSCRYS